MESTLFGKSRTRGIKENMKYTRKEYKKYCQEVDSKIGKPVSFEMWKVVQPIGDSIIGKANRIIKNSIK